MLLELLIQVLSVFLVDICKGLSLFSSMNVKACKL